MVLELVVEVDLLPAADGGVVVEDLHLVLLVPHLLALVQVAVALNVELGGGAVHLRVPCDDVPALHDEPQRR